MVLMLLKELSCPPGFRLIANDPNNSAIGILHRCELAMSADMLIYTKKASLIKGRFGGIVYMAGGIIAASASR